MSCVNEGEICGSSTHLFKDSTSSPLLKSSGRAVCKISWEAEFGKRNGTGFFCELTCSDVVIRGLFTCAHVINCLIEFLVEFELADYKCRMNAEDVKWIFIDWELDFTFIAFTDEMASMLKRKAFMLPVSTPEEPVNDTNVTILQHPEGKALSLSKGRVKLCKDNDVQYHSSTAQGSSGAAVLNDKSQIIAIHKQRGPVNEIMSGQTVCDYNVGTLMSKVIKKISDEKPWENPRWNVEQCHISENSLHPSTETGSLCLLSKEKDIHYGNGFLCRVTFQNGKNKFGLFTTKHVLLSKPESSIKLTLHFPCDNSDLIMQPNDITWCYANDQFHFTFLAFSERFKTKVENGTRKFLTLARAKPSIREKFVLIQHQKDNKSTVFEGIFDYVFNDSLCHQSIGQPCIHGSVILNMNSEVIAIGNPCGWSNQLGTFITYDVIAKKLEETYENCNYSECILIRDLNVSEANAIKSATALCRIKTKLVTCSGFLGKITLANNVSMEGLFTMYHAISYKQSFEMYFEKPNVPFNVEPNQIKRVICDRVLEYAFLTFTDQLMNELRNNGLQILSFAKDELTISSPILLLHHPEGKSASCSKGVVKSYEESNLHHISYTSFGSAGGPILNSRHQIVAIHKGTGPCDENGEALYKIGTKTSDIEASISTKRLLSTV